MGMKFLNKKGWHTGSLRNIENVWKAEQKDEAEKRKLEELRKQIREERERDEFRQLQEQAGFAPRQERLEFLYDGGLSVGKPSEGFSGLQSYPPAAQTTNSASTSAAPAASEASTPGALFEEKPQSANDAWRKLHSDPLLMIRQREQEALAQIKNNPVKMAMIRKSVEAKKKDDEAHNEKPKKVKSKHKRHSSSKHQSDTENDNDRDREKKRKSRRKEKEHLDADDDSRDEERHPRHSHKNDNGSPRNHRPDRKESHDRLYIDEDSRDRTKHNSHSRRNYRTEKGHGSPARQICNRNEDSRERPKDNRHSRRDSKSEKSHRSPVRQKTDNDEKTRDDKYPSDSRDTKYASRANDTGGLPPKHDSSRRRGRVPQLSEEERAARLREMEMDAEVHEEQRWKRLKKAEEDDAREASKGVPSRGGSFLDAVQKSVYGAEKGGSSTIEESVRRRSHFLQGRTQVEEQNAFRR